MHTHTFRRRILKGLAGLAPLALLSACGGGSGGSSSSPAGNPSPSPSTGGGAPGTGATGLRFPGDNAANRRFRRVLPSDSVPSPYPLTVVFQLFPEDKGVNYQSVFFHGIEGDFFTNTDKFYGAGPYPAGNREMRWEIAANATDPTGDLVTVNRWYQCAFTASSDAAGNRSHLFYYDLPDTSKVISFPLPAPYFSALTATHSFTWGDAPWDHVTNGGTKEQFKGIMRRLKIFTSALSVGDAASEAFSDAVVTGAGASNVWYLNANPRPNDILDKSGNGNHFSWFDTSRTAELWTA